jgi:hypothetical protein
MYLYLFHVFAVHNLLIGRYGTCTLVFTFALEYCVFIYDLFDDAASFSDYKMRLLTCRILFTALLLIQNNVPETGLCLQSQVKILLISVQSIELIPISRSRFLHLRTKAESRLRNVVLNKNKAMNIV